MVEPLTNFLEPVDCFRTFVEPLVLRWNGNSHIYRLPLYRRGNARLCPCPLEDSMDAKLSNRSRCVSFRLSTSITLRNCSTEMNTTYTDEKSIHCHSNVVKANYRSRSSPVIETFQSQRPISAPGQRAEQMPHEEGLRTLGCIYLWVDEVEKNGPVFVPV